MSNIINSAVPSEALNTSVASEISKHLFLVCNYNPESIMVYSNDAKFIKGVMNMYKFLIDAGICNRLRAIQKKYGLSPADFNKLEQIISTINSIRTCLGHNEDSRNGTEEIKMNVERWFSNIIGKKYPESSEEYEKAVDAIAQYGDESINILQSFIKEVAKHKRKQEIVEDWEKLIFDFYRRPNSKNIFKGNLKLAYQARIGLSKSCNDLDIAMWTKKMLFYKEYSQIHNLCELKRAGSLSSADLKKIEEKINENNDSLNKRKEEIARFVKKPEKDLREFDYLDYYMAVFPQKLKDEFTDGNIESLLPQDAIQRIIDTDFASIPV